MNWLDILLLILACVFVFEGLRQGFTRLAIGLGATLFGLVFASWTYGTAGSYFAPYLSSKSLANIIGFLLVFVAIQLLGSGISWLLGRFYKAAGLTWLDRLLGAAFGILKAALVGTIFVMILTAFPIRPIPDSVKDSAVAPYLIEASHVLVQLAPRELKDGFIATYDRVKAVWSGLKPKSDEDKDEKDDKEKRKPARDSV